MSEEKKYINIKEFREYGYLQELNRQFLHPLGLALEVGFGEDNNGKQVEYIIGIIDSRNDPEGFIYDIKNSEEERIKRFTKNEKFIQEQKDKFAVERIKLFGNTIEPITTQE